MKADLPAHKPGSCEMLIPRRPKRAWPRFFVPQYEDDPGFRDVILRLCRRGMLVVGILGIVSAPLHLVAYALAGHQWGLSPGEPGTIVIWDKLVIFMLGISYLILARTRTGPRWGRLIGGVIVVVASVAILVDDFVVGEPFASSRYLSLIILVFIAAIPYRPWEAFTLVFVTSGVYLAVSGYLAEAPVTEMDPGLLVYLTITLVLCTSISALLYHVRYEQYYARRRAEALGEKLQQMERVKSRFFANISHEFRTPLTLLLGPIQDAMKEGNPERLVQHLPLMQRNAQRLLTLINQLLDLSKLEAGGMHLHAREVDLVPFLRQLTYTFTSRAEHQGLTLLFDPEVEALPCFFDVDKLEKVVLNLIANALKFTPAHGKIQVRLARRQEATGCRAEIAVQDTGRGIPAQALPHIFDRFYQVEEGATRTHEGTGIGLALARELVELHHGTITVESTEGFGSTFVVCLPLGREHLEPGQIVEVADTAAVHAPVGVLEDGEAADNRVNALNASGTAATADAPLILVVEDNPDMRAYLKSHLAPHYRLAEAVNGVEGLAAAREMEPALIISDVMMPEMDGFELCHAVKSDPKHGHIPVILLTARVDEEGKLEGLETGADDYLAKPFNVEELLTRVENLIEVRRRLRAQFSAEVVLQPSGVSVTSLDAAFLDRVREVIEAQMGNTNFSVEWLADEVGVSARHLQRRLRALTRLSAKGLINLMRLKRAGQLLEQGAGTVSEIAYAVGFQNPNYFSKLFKQTFGVSPSGFGARAARPSRKGLY